MTSPKRDSVRAAVESFADFLSNMVPTSEHDGWSAGAIYRRHGGHGNNTMTSIVDVEMLMTTQLYSESVVDGATEDGWSVTQSASTWWPDETPWFRTLLIILYGSVFIGCVFGKRISRR